MNFVLLLPHPGSSMYCYVIGPQPYIGKSFYCYWLRLTSLLFNVLVMVHNFWKYLPYWVSLYFSLQFSLVIDVSFICLTVCFLPCILRLSLCFNFAHYKVGFGAIYNKIIVYRRNIFLPFHSQTIGILCCLASVKYNFK